MKYMITRIDIKYETGDSASIKENYITDDPEIIRKEIHRLYNCDRVLFVYEDVEG